MKELSVDDVNSGDPMISCSSANACIATSSNETAASAFPSHSQIEGVAIPVNPCSISGSVAVSSTPLHRNVDKCTSIPSSVTSSNRGKI